MLRFAKLTEEDQAIMPPWWRDIWHAERRDALIMHQLRFTRQDRIDAPQQWRFSRAFVGMLAWEIPTDWYI